MPHTARRRLGLLPARTSASDSDLAEVLRAIVTSSPVATHAFDLERRVLIWNHASERLFGWTAAEVIGRPLPDGMVPKVDRPSSIERIQRALAGAQINGERVRRLTKAGEERWIDIYAARLVDVDGDSIGVACQLVDVTERVRLETELLQAQRMGAIGLLASGIAHDFNNTLTVAGGYGELIRNNSQGAIAQDASAIVEAVERGRLLTRQLLDFARGGEGADRIVDLRDIVTRIEPLIRRLITESVSIELRLGAEPVFARVQVSQLEQALINLAINARDAMPRGGVLKIVIGQVADEAVIDVTDTGVGIPPAVLPNVADPFFTTKPIGQGTGLGLAMVRGFVDNASGRLSIQSQVGHGATFSIRLPVAAWTSLGGLV